MAAIAIAIVLGLGSAGTPRVQAQELDWATRGGGSGNDEGRAVATDGSGNSYITANFLGTATFGPGEPNQTTLTAAGGGDILVAKYGPSGALLWARRAGGSSPLEDQGLGIAADGAGNSCVTGNFAGTATFGVGEVNQTMLTSTGNHEIFVAKYDPNGALLWAKRAGGAGDADEGQGIATDGAGNCYVSGVFTGTSTFGTGEINETVLTAPGASQDIFVAKFDANGALVWARRAGGAGYDRGYGLALDGASNIYVTGRFSGTATFGPGEANETLLTAAGASDLFIARYDAGGALVWARPAGGAGTDWAYGIATDGAGNGYVDGQFSGTATFGAGEANETALSSAGGFDIFVAKYDPSGTLAWAKRAGSGGFDQGHGIATDGAGNSAVTGFFSGTATFGPGEVNETTLASAGAFDIFVAQYDPEGAMVWVKRAGDTGDDVGQGIAADGAYFYVTGHMRGAVTFGAGDASQTMLTSAGNADIFLASYFGVNDIDDDGVVDTADLCVPTAAGAVVNADGCSIADLAPCYGGWQNHGAYVSSVAHVAKDFVNLGLITNVQRNAIVFVAGQSDCGG